MALIRSPQPHSQTVGTSNMKTEEVKIELYYKREKSTTTMYVEKLGENKFKMTDNDIWNCRLTLGTEFETRINKDGKHEIVRISKESEFIT
jgi:galactitol-specific phosphotransferase system IIB component